MRKTKIYTTSTNCGFWKNSIEGKQMKRILLIILINTILFTGGCMDSQNRENRIRDEMLAHMREKYGKEFIEVSFIMRYGDNRSRLICFPVSGNPETDRVRVMRIGRWNDITIRDNYFGILIREEVEAEIEQICQQLGLDVKVFSISSSFYDNKYGGTKGYADIKNARYFDRNIRIAVLAEQDYDMEGISVQIFQVLTDEKLIGFYSMYFYTEEGFHILTRENFSDNLDLRLPHVLDKYSRDVLPPRIVDKEVQNAN